MKYSMNSCMRHCIGARPHIPPMRMQIRPLALLALALIAVLALAGCGSMPGRQGGRAGEARPEAGAGHAGAIAEPATASDRGARQAASMNSTPPWKSIRDQLALVGLAFGQRVMTLQYDGKELKTWRHFMLPPQVRGEDVLEDLQLTLWPAPALRAALPAGWDLQDTPSGNGQRRTLSFEGQPITVIDYPGSNTGSNTGAEVRRWGGKVVLNNLRYHYRLTIASATDGDRP